MSTLRSTILRHALPLVPTHSFTRQALVNALPSLPPSHPDHRDALPESVIDTLFDAGSSAAAQALVSAWEEEGLTSLQGQHVRDRLRNRLSYSSQVGEHLVEAYALLSAPGSSTSLPIPQLPAPLLPLLRQIRLPPLYAPPGTPSPSSRPSTDAATELSSALQATSRRLPLIGFNPAGPLSYAWRIADGALRVDDKARGVQKGLMDEPTGSGPEWYSSRISLMIAYLAAESVLLQPIPAAVAIGGSNPHLPAAVRKLDEHLDRHDAVAKLFSEGEQGMGQALNYFGHWGRTAIGLIKSRGF